MSEGNEALLDALRQRRMKVETEELNLVERAVRASGTLDAMTVSLDVTCVTGMPGESEGTLVLQGNLPALLAVLERIWPGPPAPREILSPGRQAWPDSERAGAREKP